jgi:putative inorganic carbon (HCO3(-)) transporter
MRNWLLNLRTAIRKTALFLDRWHWLLLAMAAPLLIFPSPARSPVLLIVPVLWVVAWVAGDKPMPRTPLNGTILLLSLMVLVSLYATYDIAISLPKISGMVLAIGVFYAVVREGQRPTGTPLISRLPPRLTGLVGVERGFHPNEVAGALLWVTPAFITLTVLLLAKTKVLCMTFGRARAMAIVSLVAAAALFVTGVFVLTQSRGGYIAFAFTSLTLFVIVLPPLARGLVLSSLVILVVILGVVLSQQGAEAILDGLMGSGLAGDRAFSLNTLQVRPKLWSRALYGIQDFPFTGMGMNTFRHIVHLLYPLFIVSPDYDVAHAHNEFLQAALDLGIPGLVAFLALYLAAFWMLRDIWLVVQKPEFRARRQDSSLLPLDTCLLIQTLVLGLGGGLFAHMLYGLMDAVALGAKPGILFWMLLGLISSLYAQARSGRLAECLVWRRS